MESNDLECQLPMALDTKGHEYVTREDLAMVKTQLVNIQGSLDMLWTKTNGQPQYNALHETFKWAIAMCAYRRSGYLVWLIMPTEITFGYIFGSYLAFVLFGNMVAI